MIKETASYDQMLVFGDRLLFYTGALMKEKQVFFCKECGYESAKWMGQCPGCRQWNTFAEEKITVSKKRGNEPTGEKPHAVSITEVTSAQESRIFTNIGELDRVLGGGIVRGSLVLVGGDPGIGKSTLLLEMCKSLVSDEVKVLYVSGEESMSQIKMRGVRLGAYHEKLMLLSDGNLATAEEQIEKVNADVVVIDSIQTMYVPELDNVPGSVTQVREVTTRLMQLAKRLDVAIFIVGHVTKEGTVAGPRTLEHMVDSVLYFEGDDNSGFRMLRAVKNRFGSTNEIGVFSMTETGLAEVSNPSQMFLSGRPVEAPGSVVVSTMEGTRAVLVELQALVSDSNFNMPRRTSVGVDYNRVNLLMAVLEKRGGVVLSGCDCYVSIAGGMKVNDPASDLGIISAVYSSFRNRPVGDDTVIIGEVGLAGEIRGVQSIQARVKEADKLGYKRIILPKASPVSGIPDLNCELIYVRTIGEALERI